MRFCVITGAFGLTVLLLVFAGSGETAALEALDMCLKSLIPGLFPFMVMGNMLYLCGGGAVLGNLLSGLCRRAFGLSGACSLPIAVGLISGYPVGSAIAAAQKKNGEITADEASRVLTLCNNPGPGFVTGTVAGILGCRGKGGIILWLSLTLSALLSGVIFSRKRGSAEKISLPQSTMTIGECITKSVKEAVIACLNVCGFVVMFSVITSLILSEAFTDFLSRTGLSPAVMKTLVGGIMETATGNSALGNVKASLDIKLPFASMLLAWSGFSVHAQVASVTAGSGISLKPYFKAKLLQTFTAPCIARLMLMLVPLEAQVAATPTDPTVMMVAWSFMLTLLVSCAVLAVSSAFLKNICSKVRLKAELHNPAEYKAYLPRWKSQAAQERSRRHT